MIRRKKYGAQDRNRTGDLILTKDALYRLSYLSLLYCTEKWLTRVEMERETGLEPATLSLEG